MLKNLQKQHTYFDEIWTIICSCGMHGSFGACSNSSLLPGQDGTLSRLDVEDMGIAVAADSQREYSFTDKKGLVLVWHDAHRQLGRLARGLEYS